ncbi:MAG: hypothetical protein LAO79_24290 [Acidobacteriia bacterium]|nr:hypothetical protein [Terriglobia bacterium]
MYADAILNLAWAAVCLAAFGWFIAAEKQRVSRRAIVSRAVALSLALVSLFPCVSASDDAVRIQFLSASTSEHQHSQTPQPDKKNLGTLVRLLETLDSVQISVSLVLCFCLYLFAFALIETHKSLERFEPIRAGRAPPAIA